MKVAELRKLIGKRVEWEYAHDHNRGTYLVRDGILTEVKGRNVWVDDEPYWIPDLKNFRAVTIGDSANGDT